ncbi:MAG: hypothetical protein KUG82_22125 [Pseudomonadales bacterium]|nr:hypothetical protein [Pseudomonadales bacterium]
MSVVIESMREELPKNLTSLDKAQDQSEIKPKVPWLFALSWVAASVVLFVAYRLYMNAYSFTVGLDYFTPEFEYYWMRLMYVQLTLIALLVFTVVPILWFTREKDPDAVPPKVELQRYYTMFALMAVASIASFVALGLFAEADAAWHQVTIRDTDFTPTHIGLFYFAMPLMFGGMLMAFVWVHTRLPDFHSRISIPFAFLAAGPALVFPNLGLNEWGHTFFYAEELFGAPIHYGFFVLGLGFFAFGGFLVQCYIRIDKLTRLDDTEQLIDPLSEGPSATT